MSQTCQQPNSGASRASLYDEVTDRIVARIGTGQRALGEAVERQRRGFGHAAQRRYAQILQRHKHSYFVGCRDQARLCRQEWLTFRQALSLGGHVRKGERGTTICYADSFIPRAERERAKEQGDDPNVVPFLKRFTVFNVEQCEGLPAHIAPTPQPVPPTDVVPEAERLIAASGATIREGGGEAFYHHGEDFIRLPPRSSFLTPADYYCTALHELGHWTAHPSRLARDLQHRFGTSAYAREELIAELTSAFLCAHLNIVPQIRHADYLANWLQILKDDAKAIFHAASQASKASNFLLGFCQPQNGAEATP